MRWEPFGELERTLDDVFTPLLGTPRMGWDTAVDMYERDNNIMIEMNLPGVDPDKVNVSVERNVLQISGNREEVHEDKGKQFTRKEIVRGAFSRAIRLPSDVDENKVQAKYRNGVLMIALPKKDQAQSAQKRIPIQKEEQGKLLAGDACEKENVA